MSAPSPERYVIGVDFGTLSARAILVNVRIGQTSAQAVVEYKNRVIERALPGANHSLPPDTALQDPADYSRAFEITVRSLLRRVAPEQIVGIGTDFTCCTVLPTTANGTPLCYDSKWRNNPHAWVK